MGRDFLIVFDCVCRFNVRRTIVMGSKHISNNLLSAYKLVVMTDAFQRKVENMDLHEILKTQMKLVIF